MRDGRDTAAAPLLTGKRQQASLLLGTIVVAVVASSCLPDRKGPFRIKDCSSAVFTPLPKVPENEWPSTLSDGLAAIDQLWSQPLSAQLRCPDSQAQLTIRIQAPAREQWKFYSPPPELQSQIEKGLYVPYMCDDVVASTGHVTIEGFVASKGPVAFNDVAFDVKIEDAQSFALVDSSNKALPVAGTPDSIVVDLGIGYDHTLYGKRYLRHPTSKTSGVDEVCVMTDFQMMQ
jgi:hypothetical protein